MNTRNEVLNILKEVLDRKRFLKDVLSERRLSLNGCGEQELRYISFLSRGVVERKPMLDAVLSKVSRIKPKNMKPVILKILEIGAFELLFSENAPHAVVNECVNLAVKRGFMPLKGFVNANLRTIAREGKDLLNGLLTFERRCLPEEVHDLLGEVLSDAELDAFADYVLSTASKALSVRVNRSRLKEDALPAIFSGMEGVRCERIPGTEGKGLYTLSGITDLSALPAFSDGLFYVKDSSSALEYEAISGFLPPKEMPLMILDACACPGGKSLQVADMLSERGQDFRLVACDLHADKLKRLQENFDRFGLRGEVLSRDAREYTPEWAETFDLLILDVPCSGLGDLSGKPEIRYHVTKESVSELTKIQSGILENSAKYLKKGGLLVYSTCTLTKDENDGRIAAFLSERKDFSLLYRSVRIPGVNSKGDGFFMTVLKRSSK